MSVLQPTDLDIDEALKILNVYSCAQVKNTEPSVEKEQLRQALLLVTSLSESENLGICADNVQQGFTALKSYLKALGYKNNLEQDSTANDREPVYIKFNTAKMSYYVDEYIGKYRGVLVSCQSEDDKIVGTYGHFPLDLFVN
ncbi:MAG: DUF1824 family protein [Xenococcaceae cyanobacterium MO_188.B32]|nr:DUF1824 family protein [Xenococcaceae cyanobacterium MO_188.B32]